MIAPYNRLGGRTLMNCPNPAYPIAAFFCAQRPCLLHNQNTENGMGPRFLHCLQKARPVSQTTILSQQVGLSVLQPAVL